LAIIDKFDCIANAAKAVGVSPSSIVYCLSGKGMFCKGFIWKYSTKETDEQQLQEAAPPPKAQRS
jgi:hypothetical protein